MTIRHLTVFAAVAEQGSMSAAAKHLYLSQPTVSQAIRELEALQQSRGRDPEVLRWLARAYLADGQQQRLLGWLPAQLAQMPQDSELRLLLARAQLQAGDTRGAVTTLEQNAPALVQEPTYHSLLAASYQQTGQWQQSAASYRQLVALRPGQATAVDLEVNAAGTSAVQVPAGSVLHQQGKQWVFVSALDGKTAGYRALPVGITGKLGEAMLV